MMFVRMNTFSNISKRSTLLNPLRIIFQTKGHGKQLKTPHLPQAHPSSWNEMRAELNKSSLPTHCHQIQTGEWRGVCVESQVTTPLSFPQNLMDYCTAGFQR